MLSAAKWGALVGVVSYLVIDIVLTLVAIVATGSTPAGLGTNPGKLAFGCGGIFLLLFAFSAAGFFTGRETRRAGFGAIAGMIALVFYAVPSAIFTPSAGAAAASTTTAPTPNHVALVISQIIADLIVLGIAASMGWLGGRPGAQRAIKAATIATAQASTSSVK